MKDETYEFLKKLYLKTTYLEKHSSEIFISILLIYIFFIIIFYFFIINNKPLITKDWVTKRCNPIYMPFAWMLNKDKNIL